MAKDKKINLLFDATSMAIHLKNGTGTGIYTVSYNILKELSSRKSFDVTLYSDVSQLANLQDGLRKEKTSIRNLKIFSGQSYNNFNVFFSPMYKIPYSISYQNNIQKYIFLHDVIPHIYRECFENKGNEWYFEMFNSLNKDDFYFMNSKQTQIDFEKYNDNISDSNSKVAYLACNEKFKPVKTKLSSVKNKYHIPTDKKYIFSLCTLEPRKNLLRAIKTFIQFIDKNSIDDMVFVLGGGSWKTFMSILEQELSLLGKYRDKILTIGYVADEDLASLYSGAEWFVYTSQYEGFGLPPLEAMACGCPVITSNNSSLPEVVGDAGIMIDWDSDEQHIKAYEKYYFDAKFRNEMARKGLERSKIFSWKKTVDVIENVMIERFNNYKNERNKAQEESNKIKIVYDGNLLINGLNENCTRSGVYFVVYNLLKELLKQDSLQLFLWVSDKNLNDVKKIISIDETLRNIPFVIQSDFSKMDAYLSPHADVPDVILKYGNIRTYKIVYDFMGCIFPDKIFSTKIENHQRALQCNKLFCISQSTKNDYIEFVKEVDPQKLVVSYLGANERFYCRSNKEILEIKKKLNIKNNYILSVCNLAPHKNLFTAIDAFINFIKKNNIHDLTYVLAGGCPDHFKDDFDKKMESLGKYKKYITLTGYLPDSYLPVLYSGAEWFVFPSLYEGFGLPVLEAMQCGCPVVCSNTSSMPEILGDCGILVSPKDKNDFVGAFTKMYKSANLRTMFRNKGLQQAKKFSWYDMAKTITDCIENDYHTEEKVLPIVLITDENYVAPTIVTITSAMVNRYKSTNYKFYVLGNSLSEKSKSLFSDMDNVELINMNNVFKNFEGTHNHVSAAALLKFTIPDKFPQFDKILYLDTDMLIQQDLSGLFDINISECYAAVVKDMECTLMGKHNIRLGLNNYFNSGMMLLNIKKMREDNISAKLMEYKKQDKTKYFMDQDAFNKVFSEKVYFLEPYFNYIPVSLNRFNVNEICDFYGINHEDVNYLTKHAPVCHLANKEKPWKTRKALGYKDWIRYYYMSPMKHINIKYDDKIANDCRKQSNYYLQKIYKKEEGKYTTKYKIFNLSFTFYKKYLSKKIPFARLTNTDFKLSGFSHAETWGRWSDGFYSSMIFNAKKIKDDLLFKFEVKPFFAGDLNSQKIRVYVNDNLATQWIFEKGKMFPKTEFIVPKRSRTKTGKIFLRFEYDTPKSPKELLINSDSRKLALGFISMEIKPVNAKESKLKKQWKKLVDEIKKYLPKKKAKSVEAVEEIQVVAKEIIALKNTIDALKNTTETLQKELKALRNEQLTTQKMLVNEKTLLQKKRKLN